MSGRVFPGNEVFEIDMKSVIWDFNGTILDDVAVARAVGCRPLVVLLGHQDGSRFAGADCEIYDTSHDLVNALQSDGVAGR